MTNSKVPNYVTLSVSAFYLVRDAIGSITDMGTRDGQPISIAILPPGQTFSTYQQAAWNTLKDPKAGNYVTGDVMQRNAQITTLYANTFTSNPQVFEWFGMAAFASHQVGIAMADADWYNNHTVGLISAFGYLNLGELLKFFGQGNLSVFMDMYPQVLAYNAGFGQPNSNPLQFFTTTAPQGGVPANMLLVTPKQLEGWTDIVNGIQTNTAKTIWDGNSLFVYVEQTQTLQAVLDLDLPLWEAATNKKTIHSPIPGDTSTFQGYAPGASFGNAAMRYSWTVTMMVPAWQNWRKKFVEILPATLFSGGYDN